MSVLTSLLPNLGGVLRAGGEKYFRLTDELKAFAAMLSSPSRSLRAITSLVVTPTSRLSALSLIERSSSTLTVLGVRELALSFELVPDPSDPLAVFTFPSLETISFDAGTRQESSLLPLSSPRWILPTFQTFRTNASPSLLLILSLHGSKLRQLGLRLQSTLDLQTYKTCFKLCPNLETFAWMVWEPMENLQTLSPVAFDLAKPVSSVRFINVLNSSIAEDAPPHSRVDLIVPKTVNKTNFPSLRRLSIGSKVDISDA